MTAFRLFARRERVKASPRLDRRSIFPSLCHSVFYKVVLVIELDLCHEILVWALRTRSNDCPKATCKVGTREGQSKMV